MNVDLNSLSDEQANTVSPSNHSNERVKPSSSFMRGSSPAKTQQSFGKPRNSFIKEHNDSLFIDLTNQNAKNIRAVDSDQSGIFKGGPSEIFRTQTSVSISQGAST